MSEKSQDPLLAYDEYPLPAGKQAECVEIMARRIAEAVGPRRILLFGSRARGDHRPDSDVDFLVEMDGRLSGEEIGELVRCARGSVVDSPLAKDIVALGREQVAEEADCRASVVHQALSEGTVLYER